MQTANTAHERIHALVTGDRVVLFMKGTRTQPQCGFSAAAIGALDSLLDQYRTVDVLADEAIRQGVKAYGNWPTIPQLYIDGELVGGSDIISAMFNSGELHQTLGIVEPARVVPTIHITERAAAAIREALPQGGDEVLHLSIDADLRPQFMLKPANGHELVAESAGVQVHFDRASAQRAQGIEIDWVESVRGSGLSVRNPAAPPPVQALDVAGLKAKLDQGAIRVLDVRPAADRQRAPFPAAQALDPDSMPALAALPKDTALAFLCHFGNSSRSAAEHFRSLGFTALYNVEGGVDAWSTTIDPSIPRY
jgi:monothiol glutaredoxin